MKQKYHYGDLVKIIDEQERIQYFNCCAIVIGSYSDQCGIPNTGGGYYLYVQDHGKSAWYDENQLEFIEHNRIDLVGVWNRIIDGND